MTKHDNVSQGKIMKATEFVKKFGWERAKREVALIGTIAVITGDRNWLSDLKRLVESHELVNHMGGLEKAMDAVINQEANGRNMTQLAQAIADVEACQ
ncbi:hypothetical protein [Acinetobacter radioresistens]|uniref:hypothetical protein n=1 Tax=Acinetobacter radioresistens TaxID=40216 RepID=UPI00200366F3|nr:hypothetical protein [Acinetobacter radioresistens]